MKDIKKSVVGDACKKMYRKSHYIIRKLILGDERCVIRRFCSWVLMKRIIDVKYYYVAEESGNIIPYLNAINVDTWTV